MLETARRGFKSVSRGYGGYGGSGFVFGLPGSGEGRDWNREAGVRYDNSIVFAAIQYAINAMTEVGPPYVRRPKGDGTYEAVPNHPVTALFANPNPWYGFDVLMGGWVISELAGRHGQSYTYLHRSSGKKIIGLEYVPHFGIGPFTSPGSDNFVDWYLLRTYEGQQKIPVEDVLVQRFGPINPLRPQISIGPLESVLMEICTDKESANYTAALLLNTGITPHLISPAIKGDDFASQNFSKEQVGQIKELISEGATRDNRGKALVMRLPIKVDSLSFSPVDMNLEGIRNISEERIGAALGIHTNVFGMGTGLEQANNRASAGASFAQAARSFVKPYMRRKAAQLTRALIPELGQPGEEIVFKMEDIEALQDDKTEAAKRKAISCGGAWLTVNEIRESEGAKPIEGGDELRKQSATSDKTLMEKDDTDATTNKR